MTRRYFHDPMLLDYFFSEVLCAELHPPIIVISMCLKKYNNEMS